MIERRTNSLFTFYTQSALHYRIAEMKRAFKDKDKYRDVSEFLVHNIRKLKIRAAFEEGGLQKAQ